MKLELKQQRDNNEEEEISRILNPKIFESGKFSKDGLFSQQIFGPIRSFKCACNRSSSYRGRNLDLETCPSCGVDITSSDERRRRFGVIKIPFKIFNPIFLYIITYIKPNYKDIILNTLKYSKEYIFNEDGDVVLFDESIDDTSKKLVGLNGAIEIVKDLIDKYDTSFQYVRDNFDNITIDEITVIPPDFRPCGSTTANGTRIIDEINSFYSYLLVKINRYNSLPYKVPETDDIYKTNFKHIQLLVIELYDYVLSKMSKKKGLIRSNILGKRVDFSGRAVISPDPNLNLDECSIPYKVILEILKPQLTVYLVNRKAKKKYNDAVKWIDDCLKYDSDELYGYVQEFMVDKLCILNRQPTLHRLGILGFKAKVHLGHTIRIHPMICPPYNADFDGDSVSADIEVLTSDGNFDTFHISEFKKYTKKLKETKTRSDGVTVEKYEPVDNIKIKAIDCDTGNNEYKKITEFSIHKNIEMYELSDPDSNQFKPFHSSSDHSLIVYDEVDESIKKISPKELLENPYGKYLIQQKENYNENS